MLDTNRTQTSRLYTKWSDWEDGPKCGRGDFFIL